MIFDFIHYTERMDSPLRSKESFTGSVVLGSYSGTCLHKIAGVIDLPWD